MKLVHDTGDALGDLEIPNASRRVPRPRTVEIEAVDQRRGPRAAG